MILCVVLYSDRGILVINVLVQTLESTEKFDFCLNFILLSCCSQILCRNCIFFVTAGEDRRCPHCRNGVWNPLHIPFIHQLLDEYVHHCSRDVCLEIFSNRESFENHGEQCLIDHAITDDELENYLSIYTPNAFIDIFYYNLPLIYRLAEYAAMDLWWYSLDLQDFLNENDFGNGQDIFM